MAEQEKKEEQKKEEFSSEQLVKAIRFLGGEMKKIGERQQALETRLTSGEQDGGKPEKKVEQKAGDVELMTNAQLAEFIVDKVGEAYRPYLDKLDNLEAGRTVDKAEQDLRRLSVERPELWEFQDEMKAVIKDNPKISVDDAFTLAQSRNPEKRTALDKKAAEAAAERGKKEAEEKKSHFGGLLPTSGKTAPKDDMTIDEAADLAWKELGVSEHLNAVGSN